MYSNIYCCFTGNVLTRFPNSGHYLDARQKSKTLPLRAALDWGSELSEFVLFPSSFEVSAPGDLGSGGPNANLSRDFLGATFQWIGFTPPSINPAPLGFAILSFQIEMVRRVHI